MVNKSKKNKKNVQVVETPVEVIKTAMDEVQVVKAKAQSDYDKAVAGLKIIRH